ncbi:MAG: uncharacterized protein A8A55_1496 [Amphiamblys sp. WSBS2006]|nr:MAG: uncharacterized protein A8A55_1496 [Amphiamblys sp. WSBS2006]
MSEDKKESGKMFIGGLSWATKEESLRAYYSQFGEIEDATIMKDPLGRSRCFGFVTFKDPSVVGSALAQKSVIDDKIVDAKRAFPRDGPKKGGHKVFVGGIPWDADEEEVKEVLGDFGEIAEAVLVYDKDTGKSRGFGFVTFQDSSGAETALREREIRVKGRIVDIKRATPKDHVRGAEPREEKKPPQTGQSLYEKYYRELAQAYGTQYTPEALAAAAAYYARYGYASVAGGAGHQMPSGDRGRERPREDDRRERRRRYQPY